MNTNSDDELRGRLRGGDPARDLPRLDPARADALLQDVMATELTTENRETGTRHRSRLTWLVAAAAVAMIGAAAILGVRALTDGESDPPVATPDTTEAPSLTHLSVAADAGLGRCATPTAEALATADVAFDGVVTRVEGEQVAMAPTHWYAGGSTGEVVVTAPEERLQRLVAAVSLREGERYLISAVGDRITLCGLSAAYHEDLAALYQRAFG